MTTENPFQRNVKLNERNRRVEYNAEPIIKELLKRGLTRPQIAQHAGVSQGSIPNWLANGKADAKAIDKLLAAVTSAEKKNSEPGEKDHFHQLFLHIRSIEALGFSVTLKPNNNGPLEALKFENVD